MVRLKTVALVSITLLLIIASPSAAQGMLVDDPSTSTFQSSPNPPTAAANSERGINNNSTNLTVSQTTLNISGSAYTPLFSRPYYEQNSTDRLYVIAFNETWADNDEANHSTVYAINISSMSVDWSKTLPPRTELEYVDGKLVLHPLPAYQGGGNWTPFAVDAHTGNRANVPNTFSPNQSSYEDPPIWDYIEDRSRYLEGSENKLLLGTADEHSKLLPDGFVVTTAIGWKQTDGGFIEAVTYSATRVKKFDRQKNLEWETDPISVTANGSSWRNCIDEWCPVYHRTYLTNQTYVLSHYVNDHYELVGYELDQGSKNWSHSLNHRISMFKETPDGGVLAMTGTEPAKGYGIGSDVLLKLNPDTGEIEWKTEYPAQMIDFGEESVLVENLQSGSVTLLDLQTGETLTTIRTNPSLPDTLPIKFADTLTPNNLSGELAVVHSDWYSFVVINTTSGERLQEIQVSPQDLNKSSWSQWDGSGATSFRVGPYGQDTYFLRTIKSQDPESHGGMYIFTENELIGHVPAETQIENPGYERPYYHPLGHDHAVRLVSDIEETYAIVRSPSGEIVDGTSFPNTVSSYALSAGNSSVVMTVDNDKPVTRIHKFSVLNESEHEDVTNGSVETPITNSTTSGGSTQTTPEQTLENRTSTDSTASTEERPEESITTPATSPGFGAPAVCTVFLAIAALGGITNGKRK